MRKSQPSLFSSARRCAPAATALLLSSLAAGCAAGEVGSLEDEADAAIEDTSQALVADCGAILAKGVHDEFKLAKNSSDAFAMAKAFCKEHSTSKGGSGGIGLEYAGFGIELTGSGNKAVWDKYCESYSHTDTATESLNLMTSTVNPSIVAAWAACVTQDGGLSCYKKPGENIIGLTYEELARSGDLKNVTLTPTNMTIKNPGDAKPTLYVGDTGLAFTTPDSSKDATLLLNGRTALTNLAQSCSVLVKSNKTLTGEIAKAWQGEAVSGYAPIVTALDKMDTAGWKKTMRDRIRSVVYSKMDVGVKAQVNCIQASSTCRPPYASDYAYEYKLPGLKCKNGSIGWPARKVSRNVLAITPAQEVKAAEDQAAGIVGGFGVCVSRGGTAGTYDVL